MEEKNKGVWSYMNVYTVHCACTFTKQGLLTTYVAWTRVGVSAFTVLGF